MRSTLLTKNSVAFITSSNSQAVVLLAHTVNAFIIKMYTLHSRIFTGSNERNTLAIFKFLGIPHYHSTLVQTH